MALFDTCMRFDMDVGRGVVLGGVDRGFGLDFRITHPNKREGCIIYPLLLPCLRPALIKLENRIVFNFDYNHSFIVS